MGQVQEPLGRVNHGKWLNVGVREWAAAKMLLDQSKVDADGGGKDQMSRFKRDDLGQEEWELAFRHRLTLLVRQQRENWDLWELQD